MNEITKLYENAGIERTAHCVLCDNPCPDDCYTGYLFTAEKQIELIKWLAKRNYGDFTSSLLINITDDRVHFSAGAKPQNYVIEVLYDSNRCTDFENALANLINKLWQDLTAAQKQQIKEILE